MRLNKLQNLSMKVSEEANEAGNTFRATSFKRILMKWALEHQEFSKQEFYDAVLALRDEYEVQSKQDDDTLPRAWFNEFTKAGIFILAD